MTRTPLAAISLLVPALALSTAYAQSGNAKEAAAQREVLLQTDHSWNGNAYTHYTRGRPQLTMLKLTIPPHSRLPWHTHPAPNAAYVLSGTLTLHDRASGKTRVVHQGEAFGESMNDIHRGETGDEPVVLLVTYAGTPGLPTSIPAKGEQNEY